MLSDKEMAALLGVELGGEGDGGVRHSAGRGWLFFFLFSVVGGRR